MRLLHRATDVSIRKYAEICGKLQKIYRDLQQNTETRRIPVGQISYSSIGGVSLFNGIAQWGPGVLAYYGHPMLTREPRV